MEETKIDIEETETPHPDYLKGFNEGYVIAEQMPDLAKSLDKALTESERSKGFQAGRQQYDLEKSKEVEKNKELEQSKDRYPSWLRSDRFSSLDNMTDFPKDKNMDKDAEEPDKE